MQIRCYEDEKGHIYLWKVGSEQVFKYDPAHNPATDASFKVEAEVIV